MILHGMLLLDGTQPPMRGWLATDSQRIVEIGEGDPPRSERSGVEANRPNLPLICPGFIDAHFHLPQIDSIGYDGMELMAWLEHVIFPAEMRWADENFASNQIARAYQRLLRAGTLGGAAFLTSHFHGYVQTVRVGYGPPHRIDELPLRMVVGQSLMDRHAPAALLGHELTRLARSERARVECSVNPRFAVSCSDAMLDLAHKKAARDERALIHTHLAESKQEVELVRQLFPNDPHYTGVYDRHGLLTKRTLLAHGLHLNEDEWRLIAKRQAVVVHCPTANVFLKSGLFDLDAARAHNVRLALGSDIAAGADMAMPRVARAMIETAKTRAMTTHPNAHIPSPGEVWNIMTRGNAEALNWPDAGRIAVGAMADLLVLQPPFEYDEHFIARLIYTWRDEYIAQRIVNGRLIQPLIEDPPRRTA